MCRNEVTPIRTGADFSSSVFLAWTESCAESLRKLFHLDESFQELLESAVYCDSCLSLIRDIHFVVKSIDSLQRRLSTSRGKVESLLKANYVTVGHETADLDPLDDSILSPNNTFVKAMGQALGFEVDMEEQEGGSLSFSIDEAFLYKNENQFTAQRIDISNKTDIENYADSDSKASEYSSDHDPDFDPCPSSEDSLGDDSPINVQVKRDSGRLKALILRQRELRKKHDVLRSTESTTHTR